MDVTENNRQLLEYFKSIMTEDEYKWFSDYVTDNLDLDIQKSDFDPYYPE